MPANQIFDHLAGFIRRPQGGDRHT
jgi:hypothetical protein